MCMHNCAAIIRFWLEGRFEKKLQNLAWLFLNLKVCGSEIDLRYKSIAFKLSEISFMCRGWSRDCEQKLFSKIVWLFTWTFLKSKRSLNHPDHNDNKPKENGKRVLLYWLLELSECFFFLQIVSKFFALVRCNLHLQQIRVDSSQRFNVISRELKTIKLSTKMLSHWVNRILNAIDIY